MKKNKEDIRIIGKCVKCGSLVYSNQAYEETDYGLPLVARERFPLGFIHKRCRIGMFKRYIQDISRDYNSLVWVLDRINQKEEKGGKKSGNSRFNSKSKRIPRD